jgi:hypothetical protein
MAYPEAIRHVQHRPVWIFWLLQQMRKYVDGFHSLLLGVYRLTHCASSHCPFAELSSCTKPSRRLPNRSTLFGRISRPSSSGSPSSTPPSVCLPRTPFIEPSKPCHLKLSSRSLLPSTLPFAFHHLGFYETLREILLRINAANARASQEFAVTNPGSPPRFPPVLVDLPECMSREALQEYIAMNPLPLAVGN